MNQDAIELHEFAYLQDCLLRGKGFITKGVGEGKTVQDTLYNDAPWVDPPPGFVSFDPQSSIVLPAAAAAETVVLTMDVPQGYDGVIKYISNNLTGGGFVQGSGDIVWRIREDGRPIRNFGNITSEKGSIARPRQVEGIRIYSAQRITYTVEHVANAALTGRTVCSLNGYFYPSRGA